MRNYLFFFRKRPRYYWCYIRVCFLFWRGEVLAMIKRNFCVIFVQLQNKKKGVIVIDMCSIFGFSFLRLNNESIVLHQVGDGRSALAAIWRNWTHLSASWRVAA